jgi:hypothetical protein
MILYILQLNNNHHQQHIGYIQYLLVIIVYKLIVIWILVPIIINSISVTSSVPVPVSDYCLQIDSHTDFSTNFDTELIHMFHRPKNDRAVFSTYVADINHNNINPIVVPHLRMIE